MEWQAYKALQNEIEQELATEFRGEEYDAPILSVKVKNAMREVIMKRNYKATSYTDEQIVSDLYNYFSVIVNLARFDYNQLGAEGEQSHSESSVSRTYVERDDLLKGVHAFVHVLQ